MIEVHIDLEGPESLVVTENGHWSRAASVGLFLSLYVRCIIRPEGPPAEHEVIAYSLPHPHFGLIQLARVRAVRILEDGRDLGAEILDGRYP